MIGNVISGRYEIIEKLGEGGMANVYKARCKILKRYISIKILKQELASDEEFVRKFKDEAMEVAKLSNNNIVNVYDIGTEREINYIVMEYVDGKTLKEYINSVGVLSFKVALDFAIQICNALSVAHDINLIHRDIKSQNILVSNSGIIKVTDFGIAKSTDSATITNSGKILGSAYYISPEQAKGDFVDCRSDIYSLGVVMYEMFTGKLPFTQGTLVNIALQHIQVDVVEPIELNSKLPIGINNLIIKCLQKNPVLRYQNVREITKDLLAIQNNRKYFVSKYNQSDSTMIMDPLKSEVVYGKNKKIVKLIAVFLIMFLFIVGIAFYALNLFSSDIKVPDIIGKSGIQYERDLQNLGLKYELSGYIESDLEKDFVVDTYPRSGALIKKGSVVKVILSQGFEKVKIPNLINKKLDEVRIILENIGLKIGNIEEKFSEIYDVGIIISQKPNYKFEVDKNQTIDLVVSKGKETRFIIVPNFIGLDVVEAKNLASLDGILIDLKSVDTFVKTDDQKIFDQSVPKDIEVKSNVVIELKYYNYVEKNNNAEEDAKEEISDEKVNDVEDNKIIDENNEHNTNLEEDENSIDDEKLNDENNTFE